MEICMGLHQNALPIVLVFQGGRLGHVEPIDGACLKIEIALGLVQVVGNEILFYVSRLAGIK